MDDALKQRRMKADVFSSAVLLNVSNVVGNINGVTTAWLVSPGAVTYGVPPYNLTILYKILVSKVYCTSVTRASLFLCVCITECIGCRIGINN